MKIAIFEEFTVIKKFLIHPIAHNTIFVLYFLIHQDGITTEPDNSNCTKLLSDLASISIIHEMLADKFIAWDCRPAVQCPKT